MSTEHNLSKTTLALMRYAKQVDSDFSWEAIRENIIDEMYCKDLTIQQVTYIITKAWLNARAEPRLDMPYDNDTAFIKLLFCYECEYILTPLPAMVELNQIYQAKIRYMMHELMFTKKNWIPKFEEVPK